MFDCALAIDPNYLDAWAQKIEILFHLYEK